MKNLVIIGTGIVAAVIAVAAAPAQALTTCNSAIQQGLGSTLGLSCTGGFSSAHTAFGGSDKHVTACLISSPVTGRATSVGVGADNTATGVGCTAVDNVVGGSPDPRSVAGKCDGTAHPLAGIFGSLSHN